MLLNDLKERRLQRRNLLPPLEKSGRPQLLDESPNVDKKVVMDVYDIQSLLDERHSLCYIRSLVDYILFNNMFVNIHCYVIW